MSQQGHLEISPKELRFRVEPKKQPPTILYLANQTTERVAFKVKTTAPKKYCVKPSADVIEPNGAVEVKVFMQHSKDVSLDTIMDCKDKFLIQSTPVSASWSIRTDAEGKASDVFNRKENPRLYEEKLRVALDSPPAPPSPVPEASEVVEVESPTVGGATTAAVTAPLMRDGSIGYTTSTRVGHGSTGLTQRFAASGAGAAAAADGGGTAALLASDEDIRGENRRLREQLALMELKSSEAAMKVGLPRGAGQPGAGITLLHLVMVAVLAYILGVYLS